MTDQSLGMPTYDEMTAASTTDAPAPEEATAEQAPPTETEEPKAEPTEGELKQKAEKPVEEPKKEAPKTDKSQFELKTPDGKPIKIPADATFTFKVDGKDVTVTAAEAFRDRQIDTRFMQRMQKAAEVEKAAQAKAAEVTAKEQQIQAHAQAIASHLGNMHHAVATGDIRTFVVEYAQATGLAPQKVNEALRGHYMKQAQAWYDASENERKVLDMEDRNEYSKHEVEQARAIQERTQRSHLAEKFAREAAQEAGISKEEFLSAHAKVVTERLNGRPLDLSSAPPNQVQAFIEAVVTTAILDKQSSTVGSLISEIAPDLKDEDPAEHERIAKIVQPFMDEYDHDDLKALVRQALGKAQATEQEEAATPIKSNQAKGPRTSSATSETDDEEITRQRVWEEDPLSVYDR